MKVKFFTLGCKVNQYETQALKEEFLRYGCAVPEEEKADICVINTCSVTSRADRKSKEYILKAKKENPQAKIAVCGCLAQLNKSFLDKLEADYIIPQDKKSCAADIILRRAYEKKDIWSLHISAFAGARAMVKIQDGCNNFCSFCKVPYIRGRSVSRPRKEIIDEVKRLSLNHKEIVLCGINLGSYGRDLTPPCFLDGLIKEILAIESLSRLRLSSFQPNLMSETVIALFSNPKLCPHIHFPFQSGDDRILKEMNKQETVSLYRSVAGDIRRLRPETAISCDIMVGFPSEDEESFNNTVRFLQEIKPMRTHIFSFSPRDATKLCGVKTKNHRLTRQRYNILSKLSQKLAREYAGKFVGRTLDMVAEEKKNGCIYGYTQNYIRVCLKEDVPLGGIYAVKITGPEDRDGGRLTGVIAKAQLPAKVSSRI